MPVSDTGPVLFVVGSFIHLAVKSQQRSVAVVSNLVASTTLLTWLFMLHSSQQLHIQICSTGLQVLACLEPCIDRGLTS